MKLYLVQHGEAFTEEENPERCLTDQGRSEVEKIGKFLKYAKVRLHAIEHSGKIRALETAEIIAENLEKEATLLEKDGLSPKAPVIVWRDELNNRNSDTMLVGHLPFLSKLAGLLLGNNELLEPLKFRYGCVVCLEKDAENKWILNWMIIPDVVHE